MKISVITPIFNREDCAERCLKSVIASAEGLSDDTVVEHVIVDDGSSDRSALICEDYAKRFPMIKFIKLPKNRGTNAARNTAINAAIGDFCVFLDSDDYFTADALPFIASTINANPTYQHYMFAPDDCIDYYTANKIIQGADSKVLTYANFLNNDINCDFIHTVNTDILRKYPFDEHLRIYEGLFFLRFYRDCQRMLFTNRIVTIRERSRADSVSRETIRTSKAVIQRKITYAELNLKWFREDYLAMGLNARINSLLVQLIDNYLLLANYNKATTLNNELIANNGSLPSHLKVVRTLRLGSLYRWMLKSFLLLKYNVLKAHVK